MLGLVHRWFCIMCLHHLKVDSFSTITPTWDILNDSGEGKSHKVELWAMHLVVFFGRRKVQMCNYVLIHGLGLMVWLGWSGI